MSQTNPKIEPDNLETLRVIYERRAVRKYQDRPVDRILIDKILPSSETVHLALVFGYGDETAEVHTRRTDNATFVDQ